MVAFVSFDQSRLLSLSCEEREGRRAEGGGGEGGRGRKGGGERRGGEGEGKG